MAFELIGILKKIRQRFTDSSDMLWTSYHTAKEVRDEIDACMEQLKKGDHSTLEKLNMLFMPTATFQEHAIQTDWKEEYMELSEKFDSIYPRMKGVINK